MTSIGTPSKAGTVERGLFEQKSTPLGCTVHGTGLVESVKTWVGGAACATGGTRNAPSTHPSTASFLPPGIDPCILLLCFAPCRLRGSSVASISPSTKG